MKAYHIYLLRHGMTQGNKEGRYIGSLDVPLSPEGESDISEMAQTFEYPYAELFFSSPKIRCLRTLEILYPDAKPQIIDNLAECDFGDYEGKTIDELKNDEHYRKWASGDGAEAAPNGESSKEFQMRCCVGFEQIVETLMRSGSQSAVIMAHGGTIMTILGAYAFPRRPMFEWISNSGMGYEAVITPQLWMNSKAIEVAGIVPIGAQEEHSQAQGELEEDKDLEYYNEEI
jgi:alpha-ribazole phosphatase